MKATIIRLLIFALAVLLLIYVVKQDIHHSCLVAFIIAWILEPVISQKLS